MAMTRSLPTADSAGLSIVDERLVQSGEIVSNTSGDARTGILPTHAGDLVTALASMAVSVGAFTGVFSRTGAGVEKAANNGATTVALATAPNSNSRIDVIWARCQFTASTDANNLAVLGATSGTAAQDPAKPGIPTGAIELATVLVPAGVSTTQSNGVVITATHQFTAMKGGVVVLRNQSEQDAWAPHPASLAVRLDTGALIERVGGVWVPVVSRRVPFTPAWENLLVGSGSNTGEYQVVGDRCTGEARMQFGSGYALNNDSVKLIPPVTPRTPLLADVPVGQVVINDAGTGWVAGWLMMTSAGRLELRTYGSPYSGAVSGSGGNSPISFASSDVISVTFDYRV